MHPLIACIFEKKKGFVTLNKHGKSPLVIFARNYKTSCPYFHRIDRKTRRLGNLEQWKS